MSFSNFRSNEDFRPRTDDTLNAAVFLEPPPRLNNGDVADRSGGTVNNAQALRSDTSAPFLPGADQLLAALKDAAQDAPRINVVRQVEAGTRETPASDRINAASPSQRIHDLIHGLGDVTGVYLGSESYRNREQAQRELTALGTAALPQLLLSFSNNIDLETTRRAERAVRDIFSNLSDMQLLDLRDANLRSRIVSGGLGRRPTDAENERLNSMLDERITNSVQNRLITPEWLRVQQIYPTNKFDIPPIPTEESVRQSDRMATPEGRRDVAQRLSQLTALFSSDRTTNAERELITRQLRELSQVMSPEQIANNRINSRLYRAEFLQSNDPVGSENTIHRHVLEAYRLNQAERRGSILKSIYGMGLDTNENFMRQFSMQAPAADVATMRQWRQDANMRPLGNKDNGR